MQRMRTHVLCSIEAAAAQTVRSVCRQRADAAALSSSWTCPGLKRPTPWPACAYAPPACAPLQGSSAAAACLHACLLHAALSRALQVREIGNQVAPEPFRWTAEALLALQEVRAGCYFEAAQWLVQWWHRWGGDAVVYRGQWVVCGVRATGSLHRGMTNCHCACALCAHCADHLHPQASDIHPAAVPDLVLVIEHALFACLSMQHCAARHQGAKPGGVSCIGNEKPVAHWLQSLRHTMQGIWAHMFNVCSIGVGAIAAMQSARAVYAGGFAGSVQRSAEPRQCMCCMQRIVVNMLCTVLLCCTCRPLRTLRCICLRTATSAQSMPSA